MGTLSRNPHHYRDEKTRPEALNPVLKASKPALAEQEVQPVGMADDRQKAALACTVVTDDG